MLFIVYKMKRKNTSLASHLIVQSMPSKIDRDFLRPKIGRRLQAGSRLLREWLIGAQTAIYSLVSLWQIEVEGKRIVCDITNRLKHFLST